MEKNAQRYETEQSSMYAYMIGNGVQQATELLTQITEDNEQEHHSDAFS